MKAAELKLEIFRQIDQVAGDKLKNLHGIVLNYINEQNDTNEWEKLSEKHKKGILNALTEIQSGKGISHQKVISKYRKKYFNA